MTMQQFSEAQRPAGKAHSLSCTTCRSRKVKCDHKKPVCSGCEKYGEDCVWPERRKNATRKEKRLYENIVTRLAQMEHFVKELKDQDPKRSAPNPRRHSRVTPLTTPETPPTSTFKGSSAGVSKIPSRPSAGTTHISPKLPPSPAESSPRAAKLCYSGSASEATIGTAGSCSLFSIEGIAKIDTLVGDNRFSEAVRSLYKTIRTVAPQRSNDFASSPHNYPFPSNNVILACVDDFFQTVNRGYIVLQEAEVRTAVHAYLYGQPPPGSGWKMALNVVLLHSIRKQEWERSPREYEKYLHNALALIPNVILQTPDPMTIGALLSLTSYFMFSGENHIAVSILALATQFILLAGYHNPNHPANSSEPADHDMCLHRRRLFWQAYVMDHNLMLRIGKPPLISDEFLVDLPQEFPEDGYGVYYYPGDISLSYFRQQVRLAQIQGQIYSKLYSQGGNILSAAALESEIALLDAELQEWREQIPEMIRPEPEMELMYYDHRRMICLSILHFIYFQLVVAVHSAAFRLPLLDDDNDVEVYFRPSIALCVNAARAAISLLRHQELHSPFTVYLLYQVAWTVDILFVNILENRTSPEALQDLELIKLVLSYFENYDSRHQRVASYHIIKALFEVASSVVAGASSGVPTPDTTVQCPPVFGMGGGSGIPADPSLAVPPELEMGGYWGNISFSGHDWLTSGFLQMTDLGLPVSPQYSDPAVGNQG